ncbi:methyltransferase domain-containing protein [uncultured Roseobacter sp.]|uniref:tRNA1(Val) (adenine(37)-N6)-methyltransferase n=1 Tax=uncultured Roseobacter sp. TaxID=114847 RepID=UPI0026030E52|nr:methyltransferase domain-containing protein [uncultured Roseobacter sp.]
MSEALTRDAFLGGRVQLWQPRTGYRAGVDPVLMAASVAAEPGQSVLDLGCGAGAALLCLAARVPGLHLTGVELQDDYAALARRNAGDSAEIFTADITDLPGELRQRQFDHVISNPPYFDRAASREARDLGREAALGETAPLADWVKVAAKRLKPKGYAHIIHRAERLPDILKAWPSGMGSVEVLPLAPRAERRAELVIVRARKNGRGAFKLHAPLILHAGARHTTDAEDYVPRVKAVLRDGAALDF